MGTVVNTEVGMEARDSDMESRCIQADIRHRGHGMEGKVGIRNGRICEKI